MWWAAAGGLGVVALVGVAGWLVRWFGQNARETARELGRAEGQSEIVRLQQIVREREQERDALRIALDHALAPRPTLDELRVVSAEQAGGHDRPDAGAAIDVP